MHPTVPLDTAFRDFLANKSDSFVLCGYRRCSPLVGTILPPTLEFDICKLEVVISFSNVPDLESRIARHIPNALSYAYTYWDNYLGHVAFDSDAFMKTSIAL
jgi:hypothetical protein